jgi:hypothetical protein
MTSRLLLAFGTAVLAAACAQSDAGITTSVKSQLVSDDVAIKGCDRVRIPPSPPFTNTLFSITYIGAAGSSVQSRVAPTFLRLNIGPLFSRPA